MENKNFVNDFQRVVQIMESCVSEPQLEVARNYFNLFLIKYSNIMPNEYRLTLTFHYDKLEKSKRFKLYKRYI